MPIFYNYKKNVLIVINIIIKNISIKLKSAVKSIKLSIIQKIIINSNA